MVAGDAVRRTIASRHGRAGTRARGKTIGIEEYELAAFVAQQAVEKYLRIAWIALRGEAPPHTHSLTEVGDALGAPVEVRLHLV